MLLTLPLAAHAGLPLANNVPGGLAVVPLAPVSNKPDGNRPQAWLGDVTVLVAADHGFWYAVVGLSLDLAPGRYELRVDDDGASRQVAFTVGDKKYPEQHLTLKDRGKVELSPKNLARAERDIAAIKNLKLHRSPSADNDFDFVLPAHGVLSSRFDVRPGQHVAKNQTLGLSGMTDRATGPHLHWSVVLNGAMVDPELFIAQH